MSRTAKTITTRKPISSVPGAEKAAFVERLHIILAHWPSADRLARATGVSPSAFRKWLKGDAEPSRERLVALARVTGAGIAWLAEGEGSPPAFELVPGTRRRDPSRASAGDRDWSQFMLLPRRPAVAAAAGAQTPTEQPEAGFVALRRDWIRAVCNVEPDQLLLELATGESMVPTIRDGHLLLIDSTDRTFRTYGIYVLMVNGERLVKRVQRKHDGSLVLISDNPVYQPDLVDPHTAANVEVTGRVVWAGGAL